VTTTARAIDRPCPVPRPTSLVVKNGSKTLFACSGAIPHPLSRMAISAHGTLSCYCSYCSDARCDFGEENTGEFLARSGFASLEFSRAGQGGFQSYRDKHHGRDTRDLVGGDDESRKDNQECAHANE
jgi:hypothetical protein